MIHLLFQAYYIILCYPRVQGKAVPEKLVYNPSKETIVYYKRFGTTNQPRPHVFTLNLKLVSHLKLPSTSVKLKEFVTYFLVKFISVFPKQFNNSLHDICRHKIKIRHCQDIQLFVPSLVCTIQHRICESLIIKVIYSSQKYPPSPSVSISVDMK